LSEGIVNQAKRGSWLEDMTRTPRHLVPRVDFTKLGPSRPRDFLLFPARHSLFTILDACVVCALSKGRVRHGGN